MISDILHRLWARAVEVGHYGAKADFYQQEARDALYKEVRAVIGEREQRTPVVCSCQVDPKTGYRVTVMPTIDRNNLKAEQLARLNELFNKEKS